MYKPTNNRWLAEKRLLKWLRKHAFLTHGYLKRLHKGKIKPSDEPISIDFKDFYTGEI